MRRLLAVVLLGTMLLVSGCTGGKEPARPTTPAEYRAQLKLATMTASDHIYNQGARRFAELIKERTGGRIEITVYPEGQLGKGERELLEAVQQGTIDLYLGSSAPVAGFSPSIMALDLPFLFRDYQHVDKVLDGAIGRKLLDELEKAGFKGLAFWENGFRNLTNSRRPVRTPEDVKGIKIRTMENPVHIAAWKAAGANPQPMAWGEVFGALQQGVIDAQENPVAVIHSHKLNEVQKYLSLTRHIYAAAPLIMSLKRWQEMPQADQELFLKTALEVAAYERSLGRDSEERMLQELEQRGMQVIREVDTAAWQKAMQPVYDEHGKQFKETIDAIVNTR
ncbi:MAG: TRAP transporter substrate-binding protein [Bacillota bacterium]|nr:TRAP transporter substrate-binding protein [Bacillota bacterium]MDI7249483.1 TRAP transporter substrate-binding protein [Bacillota bacterium]